MCSFKLKFKKINNHLWFNKQCVINKVFPNYITINSRNKSCVAQNAVAKAKESWLQAEIKKWYTSRDNISFHLKIIHAELSYRLHPIEFDQVLQVISEDINEVAHLQYLKQLQKLTRLLENRPQITEDNRETDTRIQFAPRIENLTDTEFSTEEINLLNQGLKFSNSAIDKKSLINFLADVEVATKSEPLDVKAVCARIISNETSKWRNTNSSSDHRTTRSGSQVGRRRDRTKLHVIERDARQTRLRTDYYEVIIFIILISPDKKTSSGSLSLNIITFIRNAFSLCISMIAI